MKKALFILSGNLSTTPRALKIIESFKEEIDIDILAINRSRTWSKLDKNYRKKKHLNLKLIGISKRNFLRWVLASIIHQTSKWIYPFFKQNLLVNAFASEKASIFLWNSLNYISKGYDFVYSFSYGSIFPANRFAQKNHFPIIIDIEDYHKGEKAALNNKNETIRRDFILKNCLTKANYITYASPLIGLYTLNSLSKKNVPNHLLVNNSFSNTEFSYKQILNEKIHFVWFSQSVDYGRGLEIIIPALAASKNQVELHIIGKMNEKLNQDLILPNNEFITVYDTLSQADLNEKLGHFDIGLAIESSLEDTNKDICLSNKIFAYAQAGLYILATNTQAQNLFIKEHSELGETVRYEINDMNHKLLNIINQINQIRALKANRFQYAKKLAWEEENKKIKELFNQIIPIQS